MKHFLFVAIMAMTALATYAQEVVETIEPIVDEANQVVARREAVVLETAPLGVADRSKVRKKSYPRSEAGTLYYAKPHGAMYRHYYTSNGGALMNTQMYVPYFEDFTYTNKSWAAEYTLWYFNGNDNTRYADEDMNISLSNNLGSGTYIPVLTNDSFTDEYYMGYFTSAMGQCVGTGYYSLDVRPTEDYPDDGYFGWMSFVDNKCGADFSTFHNNGYLMGATSHTATTDSPLEGYNEDGTIWRAYTGTFPIEVIYQQCPAPISPIYVDGVFLEGVVLSDTSNPDALKNGAVLTMYIYDLEELNNGNTVLLETLTATEGSYTSWGTDSSQFGKYSYGYLKFETEKVDDPLFGPMSVPFVLDRAVLVVIDGWNNSDVNFGISGFQMTASDDEEELFEAYWNYADVFGVWTYPYNYYEPDMAMALTFRAIMDNLKIYPSLTTDGYTKIDCDYTILRISEDGTECWDDDLDKNDPYNIGGVYVVTTCPWDSSSSDNYSTYEDINTAGSAYEWITSTTSKEYGDNFHTYVASFTAEALPDDVKGRGAIVHLQGHGKVDDTPIYILQGDITKQEVIDGIDGVEYNPISVKASTGTYNLAGQRVNDSAKGVVIKDGRKVLVK